MSRYKSVIVTEEAYALAEKLVQLGLEQSVCKAFTNAMREYVEKREQLIREIQAVRQRWSEVFEG